MNVSLEWLMVENVLVAVARFRCVWITVFTKHTVHTLLHKVIYTLKLLLSACT